MHLFRKADITKEYCPGLISYKANNPDGFETRLHLRVDEDETAVLWINANESFFLNSSAALFTWCLLSGKDDEAVKKLLRRRFGRKFTQIFNDYQEFSPVIRGLMEGTTDACELCQSGISKTTPFSRNPSAPYRVDLALTYKCNNQCSHCYNEKNRAHNELSLEEWKVVLDKLASAGVPHLVFTGGEPTTAAFLPELLDYAEKLGMVSGLNTNGRLLKDNGFVRRLKQAQLDHIQITLESTDPAIHDAMVGVNGAWQETVSGIKNAVASGIFTMTNTTLLRENATIEKIDALFDFLKKLGIETVGMNALIYAGCGKEVGSGLDEAELPVLLDAAKAAAERNGQRLLWYTPTQYCRFDPTQNGLGIKSCTAARYSLCIEPDGTVLPCQSWYEGVGNILTDKWAQIWNAPLCQNIRERGMMPDACKECAMFEICGGGCPLSLEHKKEVHPQSFLPECF